MLKGIHAVFKGMPLFWGCGYLDRALAVMERVAAASGDVKLSKYTVRTEEFKGVFHFVCVCECSHLTQNMVICFYFVYLM